MLIHSNLEFQSTPPASSGAALNSLTAIVGHDEKEEDWITDINNQVRIFLRSYLFLLDSRGDQHAVEQQSNHSPLSPLSGTQPPVTSPPPADSAVRRHVSLTYGAQARSNNKVAAAALKRSGTLQTPLPHPPEGGSSDGNLYIDEQTEDYALSEDPGGYDGGSPQQNQYGRSSPWSQGNEWRGGAGPLDDVSRALSSMDISAQQQHAYAAPLPSGQAGHPPRFAQGNVPQRPPSSTGGAPIVDNAGHFQDGRRTPISQSAWEQRNQGLQGRRSNSNLQYGYQQGHNKTPSGGSSVSGHSGGPPVPGAPVPHVPPIPQQYLHQQNQPRPGLGLSTNLASAPSPTTAHSGQTPIHGFTNTPVDVPTLIASKGYNPVHFDVRPPFVCQVLFG